MNEEGLRKRMNEIQRQLTNFRQIQAKSGRNYQTFLETITDPKLRSAFMEKRIVCVQRENEFISRLEKLHEEVRNQLLGESTV